MTLAEIKGYLRSGKFTSVGCYPLFFVTTDGAALSFEAIRANWREIVSAHLQNDTRSGWHVAAVDINWEDNTLHCDHTGERIESAYAD